MKHNGTEKPNFCFVVSTRVDIDSRQVVKVMGVVNRSAQSPPPSRDTNTCSDTFRSFGYFFLSQTTDNIKNTEIRTCENGGYTGTSPALTR